MNVQTEAQLASSTVGEGSQLNLPDRIFSNYKQTLFCIAISYPPYTQFLSSSKGTEPP